jgi:hypothetical protein
MILKAFPSYRKRTAVWVQTDTVTLTGRYWDDGSKSYYKTIDANGCNGVSTVCDRNDYPFTAPDAEVDLADGTVVVQCGVFCGKAGYAYLYTIPEEETDATPETTQETR